MMNDMNKYFDRYPGTPGGKKSSVRYSNFRLEKAREQAEREPTPSDQVIQYVNAFLAAINMEPAASPRVNPKEIHYKTIQKEHHLQDERDMVWLKFTKDKYLGVVATSNDVNFKKDNTSGIIINSLGKEWDETFVLLFPLRNFPAGRTRHDIEKAIGNYLIDKGVPILDFYSHNY